MRYLAQFMMRMKRSPQLRKIMKAGENKNQAGERAGERAGKGGVVPPKDKRFKKGQSGNPKGKPPMPLEVRRARELIKDANEKIVNELIATGEYQDLVMLGIRNTIAEGKVDGLKFLNDYIGNKPTDKVESNSNVTTTNLDLTIEQKKEFIKKYLSEKK